MSAAEIVEVAHMITEKIAAVAIGYLIGSCLTAEIVVRLKTGRSVFEYGSKNPGMANVMRVFGFWPGILVLAGDLLKTALAVFLVTRLFPDGDRILILYTGLGTVLGHNWPFWHHFSGGKGVSSTCLAIFLFSPLWGLIADAAGMFVVLFTGYLPVGAVVITGIFAVAAFAFYGIEAGLLASLLALIMFQRHFSGLKRVIRGEERRNAQFFKRKKKPDTKG